MRRFPSKTLITLALHACSNSSVVFEGAAFSNGRFESVMSWTETALHREDVLYCIPFQEGINLVHAHANLFFLLIQAAESASTTRNDISLLLNFANEDEAQESFSRTAVLLSPKNDLCIEAILDAFNPIALWVDQMQDKMMSVCSFQDLFDLSEGILGHWASMSNNSFQVIAYTKGIHIDDPVCCALIENGYHPKETVERMVAHQSQSEGLSLFRKGLVIHKSKDTIVEYPSIRQTLYERGAEFGHLIMLVEDDSSIDQLLVSLFRIFADHLQKLAHIRGYQNPSINQPYKLLFSSIANDCCNPESYHDERRLKQIAQSLNINTEDIYFIGCVHSDSAIPEKNLVHIAESLRLMLFRSYIACREGDILILASQQSMRMYMKQNILNNLNDYLKAHKLLLFFSAPCEEFESLYLGYAQATNFQIFSEGRKSVKHHVSEFMSLMGNEKDRLEQMKFENILFFEDVFLPWLLMHGNEHRSFTCECVRRRPYGKVLHKAEFGHSFLDIIIEYLKNERNGTVTSERLNMSRGSLLYNIKRCEEQLSISFSRYETRLEFMFLNEFCRSCKTRFGE